MLLRQVAGASLLLVFLTLAPAQEAVDEPAVRNFESLIEAGRYSETLAPLEMYNREHKDSWQSLYQLGYVEFRLHRIQPSVESLSRSLALNPGFSEAHKILALDLNILGRKDLAVAELEKAIRLAPESAESHYELGRIYYDQGFYLKAVERLRTAEKLAPDFVKVHHNLGLTYAALGNETEAVREFEEGLRLNAKQSKPSAWPLIDYAAYWNLHDNFEKAKSLLLEAARIDDSFDQEFDELSKAYRGLGQLDLAIESLRRAVALNPRKPEYHYVLARLYSQTHRPSESGAELSEYERAREQPSSPKRIDRE